MTKINLFNFENNQLRTLYIEDQIWFIAMDISKILNYKKTDKMLNLVYSEYKQTINPKQFPEMEDCFKKTVSHVCILNESGLYQCIFHSTKPNAIKFNKWVVSEVLPQIRKSGIYQIDNFKVPDSHIEAVEELLKSLKAQKELVHQNETLTTKIKQDQPKIDFADSVCNVKNTISFLEFAKATGRKRNHIMQRLRELKILLKNKTLPYQKYIDLGYFVVTEKVCKNNIVIAFTRITGKGQTWLHKKLIASKKLLPLDKLWEDFLFQIPDNTTQVLLRNGCELFDIDNNTVTLKLKNRAFRSTIAPREHFFMPILNDVLETNVNIKYVCDADV